MAAVLSGSLSKTAFDTQHISRVKGVRVGSLYVTGFCDTDGALPRPMRAGMGPLWAPQGGGPGQTRGYGAKATKPWPIGWRAGAEPTISEAETASVGQAYLADLQRLARNGSELGPVRDAMLAAGRRLPDAIETVLQRNAADGDAQAPVDVEALEAFIGDLDLAGGTLLESVVRRAAHAALTEAGHSAGNRDLFCLLYRQFFAQAVSQLITAVIAEKIKLSVPALHALDLAGTIADWIAKKMFSLLPNPCDVPVDDGGSLKELAGALLHETVDRALGLSAPAPALGGARRHGDEVNRFRFAAGMSDQARTRAPWLSAAWQRLSTQETIADPTEPPEPWARDLLMLANAAYVADSLAHYQDSAHWHREIQINVPLSEPGVWRGRALELLETILGYLSGDLWRITVRDGSAFHPTTQQELGERWRATEVALFSGGLDSTAGGAQIAGRPGGPALFVSYHHQATDDLQARILEQLKKQVGKRDLYRVGVESGLERGTGGSDHSQHRTRGLRFIGTGIYLAAAHGAGELAVSENGQLALNPPLTPTKAGAWSTRSVHPTVLRLINELIGLVGGTMHAVNPLMDLTKGEVCTLALECGLTEADLLLTNSCSKPASNLDGATHCGACFACLVRRSGLLAAGVPDTTAYRHTFRDEPINHVLDENLNALSMWLGSDFTRADLAVDLPLPVGVADRILPVIERGREELAELIGQANSERALP